MFTLELSETASGKLKLSASEPSLGKTSKYSSSTGYTFYVVTARALSVTWKGGEPVWEPSIGLSLDKRTSSKEAAMREFRLRGSEGTAVFWRSPTGKYRLVARGREIAPPE
jgi:hypothetical protein